MDVETRYQQALDYLYSYIDYSLLGGGAIAEADFNLDRVFALVGSLGDPQQDYPSIHIAGSKGKGSVSVLCASALQAQGYKVGLYTSPHLHVFEERIQINGEMISRLDLIQLVDEIKPHVQAVPDLTTFEIQTALAFWYFARQKVDAAVIEVGLGGRLDATNVIVPRVSVITALFLEHTLVLGDTLAQVAAEKAGIIKPGVPVVLSPQKDEAYQVVARIAAQKDASLLYLPQEYSYESLAVNLEYQTFTLRTKKTKQETQLQVTLLGPHQIENAAAAYAALQVLRDQGVPISEDAIKDGFSTATWPIRFEIIGQKPRVVLDGAHTPEAAEMLRQTVDILFPHTPIVLVFGVSSDKKVEDMLSVLLPNTRQIIFTQSSHPRAMDVDTLMGLDLPFNVPIKAVESMDRAVKEALEIAGEDALVLVTGSLFVAADARLSLTNK
ncbi:MAG: folylpolyglutamate synthase/dihydrofolate synthase family protein [Anaerolineales bacterium]|jgi:dihydrofolate synthase/folylpolyglutamate synthase